MDYVVRGGTVVNATGRARADVGVRGGVIAQLGGAMLGQHEIDASGLWVLPGGVDPHVHLSRPMAGIAGEACWADDFDSGSAAALAGGITTVGNMTFSFPDKGLLRALERDSAEAAPQLRCDLFMHIVLEDPDEQALEEMSIVAERGQGSFKIFTCYPGFDSHLRFFARAMERARDLGAMTLMHCEDFLTLECCGMRHAQRGQTAIRFLPECRPVVSEVTAVQRAVGLCELSGAPLYVVHLSSARALAVCREARQRGLPVYVETRPLYLYLTAEKLRGEQGGLYVGMPPLREKEDVAALWEGILRGDIDTLGSDHAPFTREDKLAEEHTIERVRAGVADLETMLPMFFSEGVLARGLPLERFVALTSENPARLFGLYPRKGTVQVGSDADLAIWDPTHQRVIRGEGMRSRAGYTVYEGAVVTGLPRWVIRRGELAYADGEVIAPPGSGQIIARGVSDFPTRAATQ